MSATYVHPAVEATLRSVPSIRQQACRCGHSSSAHEHFRRGSDCALCEAGGCERFRRPSVLARLFAGPAPRHAIV